MIFDSGFSGFRVLGFGFWVLGFGFSHQRPHHVFKLSFKAFRFCLEFNFDSGFRVFGFWVLCFGFWVLVLVIKDHIMFFKLSFNAFRFCLEFIFDSGLQVFGF